MSYYTIFRKNYPQPDTDMCFELEVEYYEDEKQAIKAAKELEDIYNSETWYGHPKYKSKYYAQEVTAHYIATLEREAYKMATKRMMQDWF